jgi:hypothetical protein
VGTIIFEMAWEEREDSITVRWDSSKAIFIALVLSEGTRYLGGAGIASGVDAVMIVLFGWYLVAWRREPVAARKVEGVGV